MPELETTAPWTMSHGHIFCLATQLNVDDIQLPQPSHQSQPDQPPDVLPDAIAGFLSRSTKI